MGRPTRSITLPASRKPDDIIRSEHRADCSEPNLLREARNWRQEWRQKRYSRLRGN